MFYTGLGNQPLMPKLENVIVKYVNLTTDIRER